MGQSVSGHDTGHSLRVIMCLCFDPRAPADEVRDFKRCLIACPQVLHSIELSGTFDFIFEAAVPDLASYQQKLEAIATPLQRLVTRHETSFVCRRYSKPAPSDSGATSFEGTVWVPCRDGRRQIKLGDVTKITAERDYVRIHLSSGADYLLHSTVKGFARRLEPGEFVHIHRSVIVRRDCIERMIHEGRHWKVRMLDGSLYSVSKGHQREVLEVLKPGNPPAAAASRVQPKAAVAAEVEGHPAKALLLT